MLMITIMILKRRCPLQYSSLREGYRVRVEPVRY